MLESHGLSPHLYADDTQVYGSCRPSAVTTFTTKVAECVEDATSWMESNRLQHNPEKTEVLWCATTRRQHQLPTSPLLIDGCTVSPVKSVRDLGIYIDNFPPVDADARQTYTGDVSPRCVSCVKSATRCRQPHSRCWWSLWFTPDWTIEYGNSVLVGLPAYLLRHIQSVLNAAARLVYHLKARDTSPTHLSVFTGYGPQNGYCTRRLF